MTKSKRITFILALLMAVVLWAYVLGEVDPVRTVTLRNIPIKLVDQAALSESNLVITEMDSDSINVTYTAKRSIANKIQSESFNVTADMSEVKLGENVIKLELVKPSSVTLESMSLEYLSLKTEKLVSIEKDVEVRYLNPTKEDTEPKILKLSEESAKINGASSLVEEVDRVVADLDVSRVEDEINSFTVELKAVDESGNTVPGITIEPGTVSITSVMQNTKTVPLEIPIKGEATGGVSRRVSAPQELTIKGYEEDLKGVDKVTAEAIDLTGVYENTEISVKPILPNGVELASNSLGPVLQVSVYNGAVAVFEFKETDINVGGVGEGKSVKMNTTNITVTVKGEEGEIGNITKDDFVLSADATDLEAGTHTVDLTVKSKAEYNEMDVSPEKVTIEVSDDTEQ